MVKTHITLARIETAVMYWVNHSFCESEVAGSIAGFFSLLLDYILEAIKNATGASVVYLINMSVVQFD